MEELNLFWFRRDLRLEDNTGLINALKTGLPVQPIFIFDENIIDELENNDSRINFIYEELLKLNSLLKKRKSSLKIYTGKPLEIFKKIITEFNIKNLYYNEDYEPYAIQRDNEIKSFFNSQKINCFNYKDHVIFEKDEVLKPDGKPYSIFTPYKNKWLEKFKHIEFKFSTTQSQNFNKSNYTFPSLKDIGFNYSSIKVPAYSLNKINEYEMIRNIPSLDRTSKIGPHLRFGTVSIRTIVKNVKNHSEVFLNELIWREFFMQILYHFPKVMTENFKKKYNHIEWLNNENDFAKWCNGNTGYPIVDAGMRELNKTGFMHNRVRMITASFLCKHLLIDWRWGEAYFANKLLDFELASNNGNWQWCAGTGCDSSPYFRIFNPYEQTKKFDKNNTYINKWLDNKSNKSYPDPIIEHSFARKRALEAYKQGINKYTNLT